MRETTCIALCCLIAVLSSCSASGPGQKDLADTQADVPRQLDAPDDACDGPECPPARQDCPACDDGRECTLDECGADGACEHSIKPATCLINGLCFTTGDSKPGNGCQECIPELSNIAWTVDDTNDCDDADPCTPQHACSDGTCVPSGTQTLSCDDGNPCTDDACQKGIGCTSSPNAAPCDDGNACSLGDACQDGDCAAGAIMLDCNDLNPCTSDVCTPEAGCSNTPQEGVCDTGDTCSSGGHCASGQCVSDGPVDCSDSDPCTLDHCAAGEGCTHVVQDGPCDDGSSCTVGDACVAGVCGGTLRDCNDNSICTLDGCDPALPGGCTHSATNFPCDDGNVCTVGDVCSGGTCVPGPATPPCEDGNPCTKDMCDPAVGCKHTNIVSLCDDGNACTLGDYCDAGACKPGNPTCKCTADADCAQFDDGDLCNGTLACDKTSPIPGLWSCIAKPGSSVVCDHSGDTVCLVTKCLPYSGQCVKTPVNDGVSCDDGSQCTEGDGCESGTCVGTKSVTCDDGNPCSWDTCSAQYGCMYQQLPDGSSCGTPGWSCLSGHCVACKATCGGQQCGSDGCGGSCGTCPVNQWCVGGSCVGGCSPKCAGKQCGDDGCGGTCGSCAAWQVCQAGTCAAVGGVMECKGTSEPSYPYCTGIDYVGCCDAAGRVLWCDGGSLYCIDCSLQNPSCGWSSTAGFYDCGTFGGSDPSGYHPKSCTACIPACWPGSVCINGQCFGCQPQCMGKQCGDDGCGSSCGMCQAGFACQAGLCVPLSGCGSVTSQGQCQGSTVWWCQGGQLKSYDCALEGKTCAFLDGYGLYGCKTGCGAIPAVGKCDGTVLYSCLDSGVDEFDCAIFGMGCGWDAGKGTYWCVANCGDVTAEGKCVGSVLYFCDDSPGTSGTVISVDCAAQGKTCGYVDPTTGYACIDSCGGVSVAGYCSGSVYYHCDVSTNPPKVVSVDCALTGKQCGLVSPTAGYGCIYVAGGNVQVSGTVTYDKRTVSTLGFGNTVKKPARHVSVTVWDTKGTAGTTADDVVLAEGSTDANGAYSLAYKDPGTKVYVAAYAYWTEGPAFLEVDLADDWGSGPMVGVSTPAFMSEASASKALAVTVSQGSGAFNILDRLQDGRSFAVQHVGVPPSMAVTWDGPAGVSWCTQNTWYDPKLKYINISHCLGNPDEFDDAVILHEYGHHVSTTLSKDDSPGGPHWVDMASDPRLAWSEGFASFFGAAVLGSAIYIDAQDYDAFSFDLEAASSMCPAKQYLGLQQNLCEALVAGALWDINDAQPDAHDTLAMGPEEILDVVGEYFTGPLFDDRGVAGSDLVDFLDGWFCLGHQKYSDLYELIVNGAKFPYDFAMPCQKLESPVKVTVNARAMGGHRFAVDATVTAGRPVEGAHLVFHLPDGARLLAGEIEQSVALVPGTDGTFRIELAVDRLGVRAGASISYAPHPAVRFADSSAVYLGPPPTGKPASVARSPRGGKAALQVLDCP